MTSAAGELKERIGRYSDGLRSAGVRLTHQRLEICREIAGDDGHPDAETVYHGVRERVPTISLDTVYRTLWLLRDLGLIDTLGFPRERIRFDGNLKPHHHFVCTRCGRTRDFTNEEFDRLAVPEEVKGYGVVEKAQVELRGVCQQCSDEA